MLDWGSIYRIIHYKIKIADLIADALEEKLGEKDYEREAKGKKGFFKKLFG